MRLRASARHPALGPKEVAGERSFSAAPTRRWERSNQLPRHPARNSRRAPAPRVRLARGPSPEGNRGTHFSGLWAPVSSAYRCNPGPGNVWAVGGPLTSVGYPRRSMLDVVSCLGRKTEPAWLTSFCPSDRAIGTLLLWQNGPTRSEPRWLRRRRAFVPHVHVRAGLARWRIHNTDASSLGHQRLS